MRAYLPLASQENWSKAFLENLISVSMNGSMIGKPNTAINPILLLVLKAMAATMVSKLLKPTLPIINAHKNIPTLASLTIASPKNKVYKVKQLMATTPNKIAL